jgi:hypothetical protein
VSHGASGVGDNWRLSAECSMEYIPLMTQCRGKGQGAEQVNGSADFFRLAVAAVFAGCAEGAAMAIADAGSVPARTDATTQSMALAPAHTNPSDAGPFGFQRDIYPIFIAECGRCHSVNGPYHDIASPDLQEAYGDAVEFAERVVARIRLGNMPPGCVFDDADCVSSDDFALIERWVAEGMPE